MAPIEDSFVLGLLKAVFEIPEAYRDAADRKNAYSLGVRANIITLVFTSQYSAMVRVLGKGFYKNSNYEALIIAHDIDIRNVMVDKLIGQDDLVGRLLRREKLEPPFDVEFAFKQLNYN
jgi:hypothetical protein